MPNVEHPVLFLQKQAIARFLNELHRRNHMYIDEPNRYVEFTRGKISDEELDDIIKQAIGG